jgi:hypothetical protein
MDGFCDFRGVEYNCKLAELGDALMNLVEGPHCTTIDPHLDGDARAIQRKARSLVTRFEKLGRSRDALMVAVSQSVTRLRVVYHLTSRPRARKKKIIFANWKQWMKTNKTKIYNRFLQPRLALMLPQDCNAKME